MGVFFSFLGFLGRRGCPGDGYQFPGVRLAYNNYIVLCFHMGVGSIVPGSSCSSF